ncbi:hypothetical protein DJ480_18930 [Pseudomonas sp. Leaf98]|nr:hypothetical protein DJ480_18930 [Pseudomonas sp. Leaf98]
MTGVDQENQKKCGEPGRIRSCLRSKECLQDRSHALRGNAALDAPRPASDAVTQSVRGCVTTRSVGTIKLPVVHSCEILA